MKNSRQILLTLTLLISAPAFGSKDPKSLWGLAKYVTDYAYETTLYVIGAGSPVSDIDRHVRKDWKWKNNKWKFMSGGSITLAIAGAAYGGLKVMQYFGKKNAVELRLSQNAMSQSVQDLYIRMQKSHKNIGDTLDTLLKKVAKKYKIEHEKIGNDFGDDRLQIKINTFKDLRKRYASFGNAIKGEAIFNVKELANIGVLIEKQKQFLVKKKDEKKKGTRGKGHLMYNYKLIQSSLEKPKANEELKYHYDNLGDGIESIVSRSANANKRSSKIYTVCDKSLWTEKVERLHNTFNESAKEILSKSTKMNTGAICLQSSAFEKEANGVRVEEEFDRPVIKKEASKKDDVVETGYQAAGAVQSFLGLFRK